MATVSKVPAHNALDLTGKVFGELTVLERIGHDQQKRAVWKAVCSCGNFVFRLAYKMSDAAKKNTTQSCGCMTQVRQVEANTKHGLVDHPLNSVYHGMKKRCNNPKDPAYKNYGGRGIKVCREWADFKVFYDDMVAGYKPGLQLDRRDNNMGYSKDNCRWVSPQTNSNNRRDNVKGVDLLALSASSGLSRRTVYQRLKRGWPASQLTLPIGRGNQRGAT